MSESHQRESDAVSESHQQESDVAKDSNGSEVCCSSPQRYMRMIYKVTHVRFHITCAEEVVEYHT